MADADALVTSNEDNFWRNFMPAGTAASDAMAVDQSGQQNAEGGTDTSQAANATVSDDGRGGKWAKDNQKGRAQQGNKDDKWESDAGHGRETEMVVGESMGRARTTSTSGRVASGRRMRLRP